MRQSTRLLLSQAPGYYSPGHGHGDGHGHGHALPCRDKEGNKSRMFNEREYSCCCPSIAALLRPKSQGIQWGWEKRKATFGYTDAKPADLND